MKLNDEAKKALITHGKFKFDVKELDYPYFGPILFDNGSIYIG
jgi:hypothetical protein